MKKILLSFIAVLLPLMASADPVEIGGIYYNLVKKSKRAEVTSKPNKYTGEVNIPSTVEYEGTVYNVTSIGYEAFNRCYNLTSVSIPNSVTSIGESAFSGCSGLTSVNLSNNMWFIGEGAFNGCIGLTSINIPNSVTDIRNYAFSGCSNLTTITLGKNIMDIGYQSFAYCTELTDVYCNKTGVPNMNNWYHPASYDLLPEIPEWEYEPCTDAFVGSYIEDATLHVPASAKSDYESTEPWSNFGTIVAIAPTPSNIVFADVNVKAICVTNWDTNSDGELSETEAAAVTNLRTVFQNNETITSFDELQYFTGLTSIGVCDFKDCSSLTSVTIPSSVTSIAGSAFQNCGSLTSVTIPSSVTSIANYAFAYCYSLTSVNITDLAAWCRINFADPIGHWESFYHLYLNGVEIKNLVIPNSVTTIGEYTFNGCIGLTSLTIPDHVTDVEDFAFSNCSGLTSIEIGSGAEVSPFSFDNFDSGSQSLTSITVANGNPYCDSRDNCNAIILSDNTLILGCKNTIIPNSVTSIGENAFYGCSGLTSITIPNSVTSIGLSAFKGCSSLTSVTVDIATPLSSIGSSTFSNRANATLYVPSGSEAAYSAAPIWQEFKEIKAIPSYESVTITSAGMATYCSANDLDFTDISGIKAYIASGFNPTTGVVFIMHVNEVPANTGIMLKGTPGTYQVPQKSTDMYYVNMFKGTLSAMTVPATENGYKNYVLGNGSQGLLFYGSNGGSTLDANRAYLQIPLSVLSSSPAPTRGFVRFSEDDATGIITPELMLQEEEGDIYNLNGQRVESPKKGLYIKNGKKIIIR